MHSLLLLSLFALADAKGWLSPVYQNFFEFPLPVPPTAKPVKSYDNIDYYEIDIKPVDIEIYPGKKARHVGYDGIVPGPTFRMQQGREAVVRFINHADRANSVHLHGSYSRAPFDGWAEDTTEPGQYKDYYYPNAQAARTLWYHDHAVGHTAENAYCGQAGFYILEDAQKNALNLPSGNYDIPLALAAKRYNADGTLWDPEANGETTSVFGDVIQVNGQPWPYLAVEPRKYLFRFLDTSISRSFQLYAEADKKVGTRIPFTVIGSDAGLLASPVDTTQLDISMAERWEVVFDFSAYAGQNVTLKNTGKVGADDDFDGTDRVMRFMVGNSVSDTKGNGPLPSTLRTVPMPPPKTGIDRSYEFMRSNGEWQVNGVTWADVEDRVIAKPQRGAVELWELKNGAGGWTHPIHIHLIDFQIISRTDGDRGVLPYEKTALKDVVWLNKNERVQVLARYGPWDGLYMFHCHNLIHEDHDMMAALNVTHLTDLGYDEKTSFIDPMDTKYRAKSFDPKDLTNRDGDFEDSKIEEKCRMFQDLDAYKKANEVEEKLVEYWKTKSTLVTKVSSSGGGGGSSSSSSGSGSVSASATVVSSFASVSSGSSVTPSSTLVTSANKASSTSTTKTTSSSTKSDDKGGKSKTSTSSTKK
ncbi:oxidase cueO precursor [Aureobasidium pullulans]|uniref:Oxidase cueO n=1 Tax=Aureobasidium pullulans TaxID=5580 RepID=A0AB74JSW8_AURPU|nr:oxidase cueO precursor [Aureobasidium pullulans]THX64556.1 oxidase cueO precursor [Aureobasidium pullulans]